MTGRARSARRGGAVQIDASGVAAANSRLRFKEAPFWDFSIITEPGFVRL
jgi:hypothetical protein